MIAVDTNLLVFAHRMDSAWHRRARACLVPLVEGHEPWAIPWPCVYEFLAIVTHPKIYRPPTSVSDALSQVDAVLASPSVVTLTEQGGHWPVMRDLVKRSGVTGPKLHDARIAALCLHHRVRELWTADRDFSRFPALKTKNPLIDTAREPAGD